ncbi:MAG: peptidoglycan DD-metalloendopeptidase family protein [Woeseiaceae bacterium]|jgi:lipoprotein NlpD
MTARTTILLSLLLVLAACSGQPSWQDTSQRHIVRSGETLYAIAFRYGRSPEELARWNRLGDGSLIYPGQVLRLTPPPGGQAQSAARPTTRPAAKPLPNIPAQPSPPWSWPTRGRINVEFGAKPGPGTGVLIDGKAGQPVVAAAAGRVVYAGSGLIGYGQLIILKHNQTYLSAYGYTASLLVNEGEEVAKGQRIATMGEGPERKPRLHFEIRRNGKPVNPRQFLPAN